MSIFNARTRSDCAPKRETETHFEFFDRVAGPFWDRLREVLETWFSRFPMPHAIDLRSRLRSDDDNFDGAWWELYLHQVLVGAGRTVVPHPEVPGSAAHPDFLVREVDGSSWFLEARLRQDGEASAERRVGQIIDSLNRVPSSCFFLWVTMRRVGTSTPSLTALQAEIHAWLGSLDADAVLAAVEAAPGDLATLPSRQWRAGDWWILFRAIPKKREARGREGVRTVGVHGGLGGRWVSEERDSLARVLSQKAKKYGDLPHPLVLALRMTSPYAVPAHVFGDRTGERDSTAHPTMLSGATARRRVAALLLASPELQPVSVCSVTPILVINGSADRPMVASLPFPVFAEGVDIDEAERNPLADLDRALRLPPDFRELKKSPFVRGGDEAA